MNTSLHVMKLLGLLHLSNFTCCGCFSVGMFPAHPGHDARSRFLVLGDILHRNRGTPGWTEKERGPADNRVK